MSAISRGCAAGAVLIAGVCVSTGGGPSRVIVCSPTPVPRVDNPPGLALDITVDEFLTNPLYKGGRPANFYKGLDANGKFIGASCDLPAAFPGFQPVTDGGGQPVLVNGDGTTDPGNGRIYPLYQPKS